MWMHAGQVGCLRSVALILRSQHTTTGGGAGTAQLQCHLAMAQYNSYGRFCSAHVAIHTKRMMADDVVERAVEPRSALLFDNNKMEKTLGDVSLFCACKR